MEEIKISHSLRGKRTFSLIFFMYVFCAFYYLLIKISLSTITYKEFFDASIEKFGISESIFYGLFCLFSPFCIYIILKERIVPCYIITNKSFIIASKKLEIFFTDVERFVLYKKTFDIRYRSEVERQKYNKYTRFSANGLTVNPQELLDLLNERLEAAKKGVGN